MADAAPHTSSPTPRTPPFAPAQWEQLRADDLKAAQAIVGLMIGIFVLGLAGYLVVCYWVS